MQNISVPFSAHFQLQHHLSRLPDMEEETESETKPRKVVVLLCPTDAGVSEILKGKYFLVKKNHPGKGWSFSVTTGDVAVLTLQTLHIQI